MRDLMRCLVLASLTAIAMLPILGERVALAADPTTADCLAAADRFADLRPQHKLREARDKLLICSAATCPGDVRQECGRRLDEINALMPTIVFETKDSAGNDVAAVKVTMDGQLLATRLEGVALSIDPGEHSFTFEVSGQPAVEKSFVIREGEKERRERVVLVGPPGTAQHTAVDAGETPPMSNPGRTQRTIGILVGATGLVGMGVSTALALIAKSQYDTAVSEAGTARHDDSVSAHGLADAATIVFIAGAVATAGGALLWLTAPRAPIAVGVSGRQIVLSGSF